MPLRSIAGLAALFACSLLGGSAAAQDPDRSANGGALASAAHSTSPCPAPATDTTGWRRVTSQAFPVSLLVPLGFRPVPMPPGANAPFEFWALGPGGRTDPGDAVIGVERADSVGAALGGGAVGPMGGVADEWASCDEELGGRSVRLATSRELVTGSAGHSIVVYHVVTAYERRAGDWIILRGFAFAPDMQRRLLAALRTVRVGPE